MPPRPRWIALPRPGRPSHGPRHRNRNRRRSISPRRAPPKPVFRKLGPRIGKLPARQRRLDVTRKPARWPGPPMSGHRHPPRKTGRRAWHRRPRRADAPAVAEATDEDEPVAGQVAGQAAQGDKSIERPAATQPAAGSGPPAETLTPKAQTAEADATGATDKADDERAAASAAPKPEATEPREKPRETRLRCGIPPDVVPLRSLWRGCGSVPLGTPWLACGSLLASRWACRWQPAPQATGGSKKRRTVLGLPHRETCCDAERSRGSPEGASRSRGTTVSDRNRQAFDHKGI